MRENGGRKMDSPWADVLGGIIPITVVIVLLMLSPAIIGTLIGHIIRFFRYLFGIKDEDEE